MHQDKSGHNRQEISGCFAQGTNTSIFSSLQTLSESGGIRALDISNQGRKIGHIKINCDACTFADNSVAILIGTPNWKNNELAEKARISGDSAALAKAYEIHGNRLQDYLGGAFSFVIIDASQQKLWAAIDRIGQHTLYYSEKNGTVTFGSTAASVKALTDVDDNLSEQGIYDYVYFHMIPSPKSIYPGLRKLPAAHCLEVSNDGVHVSRYWSPQFSQKSTKSFSDLGKELKIQLRSAVEKSLDSTRSFGTFLSGGLDSSTVTGMLAELRDKSCPAYAIGFDQDGYDEMAFARVTAKKFGVNLREYYVTPKDVLEELPRIATSYDEPFGNSSALPAYFCGKRAAEDGIDCLLAGDGGDEIFAGNERYSKQQVFSLYGKVPRIIRNGFIEPIAANLPEHFPLIGKVRSYIDQANTPLPDRLQSYNYLHRFSPADIFSDGLLEAVDASSPIELLRDTYWALADASELSRMLYLDWQYTLADNDLRKVSRMCDLAGIDVQYPMLDEELIDFSCSIPDKWKIKGGDLRHFYKESLKGWLPDATINKRKQGFGLPFGLWMRSYKPLSELAHDSVLRLKKSGYFKTDFLDRIIKLHREDHAVYYGELIWILTIFDLWLEGKRKTQPGS